MNQNQYPQINLADWQQVGEGGNGKTCVNPAAPGEILKLNNARLSTLEAVEHDTTFPRPWPVWGFPSPKGRLSCSPNLRPPPAPGEKVQA